MAELPHWAGRCVSPVLSTDRLRRHRNPGGKKNKIGKRLDTEVGESRGRGFHVRVQRAETLALRSQREVGGPDGRATRLAEIESTKIDSAVTG